MRTPTFPIVPRRHTWPWVFASLVMLPAFVAVAADKPNFNRDVRPILAENCFACHGPDSARRKADLRLDRREVAVRAGVLRRAARRKRNYPSHLRYRQRRGDAAAEDPQAAYACPERKRSEPGSQPGPSTSRCGRSSRPFGPRCLPYTERTGSATRSIVSSWPRWRSTDCSRPPRPTAAPWPGG